MPLWERPVQGAGMQEIDASKKQTQARNGCRQVDTGKKWMQARNGRRQEMNCWLRCWYRFVTLLKRHFPLLTGNPMNHCIVGGKWVGESPWQQQGGTSTAKQQKLQSGEIPFSQKGREARQHQYPKRRSQHLPLLFLLCDNNISNIRISFGFSVGDFLTAIELANRIRSRFIDAPDQFRAISNK